MEVKILVIDDDDGVRTMMATALQGWGYQVCEAADGAEGMKMVEAENPNLVITDLTMPKMRGEEVIRNIKTNPRTQRIKVIACSGDIHLEPVVRAVGCDSFLPKPFVDIFLLKKEVERLLS